MTRLSRRQMLGCGMLLLSQSCWLRASARQAETITLFSAVSDAQDQHWVLAAKLNQDSIKPLFQQLLPGRGHHVAISTVHDIYIAVARRPGTWLITGDIHTGEFLQHKEVPEHRHLYGHAVFSADEQRFYTTESDFPNMEGDSGLVVEWLITHESGKPVVSRGREFPSGGVGPHELKFLPDGQTMVVANGGMRTHPDSNREVLNADTMQPSLAYLDVNTGEILEQVFLPEQYHQCSIRHMDVNASGVVALGMQFQGEAFLDVPLIATHRRGESLQFLQAPAEIQRGMHQYVGSVRFSADGRFFAASCPRGNMLTFWDSQQSEFVQSIRSRDGCGLSATWQGFVFSSGVGKVSEIDLLTSKIKSIAVPAQMQVFWDNHLSTIAEAGRA